MPIMQLECYFYIKVLDYISEHDSDDTLIMLFHYYLLILGLTNRMLVQQPQCFGFEEFQKYTMNGFREYSEETYLRRFYQMAGNELNNIRLLEGRFSPKDSLIKDQELLSKIHKGWEELGKLQTDCNKPVSDLKLIAHFIKQPEKKRDDIIRFKALRSSLNQKSKALAELRDSKSKESKKVVGIDAAASEFDTPPEVFAPSFRFLRERGYQHFTYHAGEDFFHILSGLRAMYEAVEYLNLQRGDRIGHGTASGVSPDVWRDNIGERLLIRQGEYLDDLIFSFHLISNGDDEELKKLLPRIGMKIDDMSYSIYQTYRPILAHIKAWQMRGDEPETIAQKANPDDTEILYLKYHQKETDERYAEAARMAGEMEEQYKNLPSRIARRLEMQEEIDILRKKKDSLKTAGEKARVSYKEAKSRFWENNEELKKKVNRQRVLMWGSIGLSALFLIIPITCFGQGRLPLCSIVMFIVSLIGKVGFARWKNNRIEEAVFPDELKRLKKEAGLAMHRYNKQNGIYCEKLRQMQAFESIQAVPHI